MSTQTPRRRACCAASSGPNRSCGSSRPTCCRSRSSRPRERRCRRSRAWRNGRHRGDGRDRAAGAADGGRAEDQERKDLEAYEKSSRTSLLEEARRGVSESSHRHRHRAVYAAQHARLVQREPNLRRAWPPPRRPGAQYMEHKGFMLVPTFVFIDGRTGARLHRESSGKKPCIPRRRIPPPCRPTSS